MKEQDTITITLASDVHVGYGEKKPCRKYDSLVTFEEVLNNAKITNSDCILLGRCSCIFFLNNQTSACRW